MTRRDLRLGSGSVLFAYITAHLANHALGLVSVNVAEAGLRVAVAFWHSLPGTALLYSAAAIHLAFAMVAVYERRTLQMPVPEALRIALGFGIPLLLIGHLTSTRFASELYGFRSDYASIVRTLWTSDSEGRQIALLVPGWLHGCLGLNFAFGRRPLYRRMRPLLFGAALVLPVLAGLGFLPMGRELAVLGANRAWLEAHVSLIGLVHIREGLLAAYLGAVGLVLAARGPRSCQLRPDTDITVVPLFSAQSATLPGHTLHKLRRYDADDITISYDVKRCIHAEECVRGLPRVFDRGRRVWVDPTQASAEDIENVVQRCPSGALHYRRTDGGPDEPTPSRNEVRITPDGPLYFRGELEIHTPTAVLNETRAALCRCGASRNKPFCDNSHADIAFRALDQSGIAATARETKGGLLRVIPATNGPCVVEGSLTLVSNGGSARVACGPRVAFRRCGHSRNKPFCDGSHVKAGFRDVGATLSPRPQGVVITRGAEPRISASGRARPG